MAAPAPAPPPSRLLALAAEEPQAVILARRERRSMRGHGTRDNRSGLKIVVSFRDSQDEEAMRKSGSMHTDFLPMGPSKCLCYGVPRVGGDAVSNPALKIAN